MLTKMTNYIIDGNINFYEELMKDEETDENNVCLLSNLPLDETHIELPCSHKFNYIYIFNEIKSSRKLTPSTYSNYSFKYAVSSNEIMCPYCRKRFDKLLPPCKNIPGTSLFKNVNSSNSSKSLNIKCKCENLDSDCNSPVYVTDIGYYCIKHYRNHRKNINKEKKTKQPMIKKNKEIKEKDDYVINYNKQKNNHFIDSSFNIIPNTSIIPDTSMNTVLHNSYIGNNLIDLSELQYNISKKYTINSLKEILKKYKLPVSGRKIELITRIIDNNLYKNL
jgi:hypothetical protein